MLHWQPPPIEWIQPSTPPTVAMVSVAQQKPITSKRDQHFPYLAKGINLEGWFAGYGFQPTQAHVQSYLSLQDIRQIKSMGFTHVRLPVDPEFLLERSKSSKLDSENLKLLTQVIRLILSQNLAVVVDMHPNDSVKQQLATDNTYLQDFAVFWNSLAHELSQVNENKIFFEVLNEPHFQESTAHPATRWQTVQNYLVKYIRKGAPNNTIIITSYRWDNVSDVIPTGIPADSNTVYSIHFYEPLTFTHQGANWISPAHAGLQQLPYPESDEKIDQLIPKMPPASKKLAFDYQSSHFNQDSIRHMFLPVIRWAQQNNIKLYVSEFGVFKSKVDPVDRARWIQDVRRLCVQYGMGWSFWEYNHGFALMSQKGKIKVPDPIMLKALGFVKNPNGNNKNSSK
jgi:hypothetical protein